MRCVNRGLWAGLASLLLFLTPCAFGQGSVNINLTSGGPYVMNGVYVGPYSATVNGQSTQIICDDFSHDSYVGESWTANVTNFSNYNGTGTLWSSLSNASTLYADAAWLATQMFKPANENSTTEGYLAFALWSLFNPSATKGLSTAQLSQVNWWLSQIPKNLSPSQFANFFIYTPNLTKPITCNGGPCPTAPPQEFLGFLSAPEGGPAIAYLMLGLASCMAAIWRRPRKHECVADRQLI